VDRSAFSISTTACARASSDAMAAKLHFHSRLVFWLKILLPVLALAILSTLFLFARRIDVTGLLPYAQNEIDQLAADPRLTAPKYSGVTSDGAKVTVSATTARPGKDPKSPVTAVDVTALYEATSGETLTLHGKAGTFDLTGGLMNLTGDVVATTPDGYKMTSDEMSSSLKQSVLTADHHVVVLAPFGRIDAGAMRLSGPPGAHLLVFNQGVRLVYNPKN